MAPCNQQYGVCQTQCGPNNAAVDFYTSFGMCSPHKEFASRGDCWDTQAFIPVHVCREDYPDPPFPPIDPEDPPIDPPPIDPEDPPIDPPPIDPEDPPIDPPPIDPEDPPIDPPLIGPDEPPLGDAVDPLPSPIRLPLAPVQGENGGAAARRSHRAIPVQEFNSLPGTHILINYPERLESRYVADDTGRVLFRRTLELSDNPYLVCFEHANANKADVTIGNKLVAANKYGIHYCISFYNPQADTAGVTIKRHGASIGRDYHDRMFERFFSTATDQYISLNIEGETTRRVYLGRRDIVSGNSTCDENLSRDGEYTFIKDTAIDNIPGYKRAACVFPTNTFGGAFEMEVKGGTVIMLVFAYHDHGRTLSGISRQISF